MATSHKEALIALIGDIDAIKEDLVDPMAHSHAQVDESTLDCLGCLVLARLSNATEFARKDLQQGEQ